jgi:hypothetical protein
LEQLFYFEENQGSNNVATTQLRNYKRSFGTVIIFEENQDSNNVANEDPIEFPKEW